MQSVLKQLPIEYLARGEYQPRLHFDEDALKELAQSILTQGLIEPLIVREISHQNYEIIAGERRWRAAMMAGLSEVPCLISQYTDQQTAAIALIENIQREGLNPLEEAQGYERLSTEFHLTQNEIATLIGKSRSHIANILRLLTLCPFVQEKLQTQQLSLGHARALVGLATKQQEALTRRVCEKGWSVRRLEEEVRLSKLPLELPSPTQPNADLRHLETLLSESIGTPVHITVDNTEGGWLNIKFFNNDALAGLLDRLGFSYDK